MTRGPETVLGLPEALVGLLPGGGGTQRLPRLIGMEASLPVLLDGVRFDAAEATHAGAAHEAAVPGDEITAAERWILSGPDPRQLWDRPGWQLADPLEISAVIVPHRAHRMVETFGHYPAIIAILDCLERGMPLPMNAALETEMEIFAHLIQRPEPRAMIRALFMGRLDFDRCRKKGAMPEKLSAVLDDVRAGLASRISQARNDGIAQDTIDAALRLAGFQETIPPSASFGLQQAAERLGYWFERQLKSKQEQLAAEFLAASAKAAASYLGGLSESDERAINYAACTQIKYPRYTGGPLALARYMKSHAAAAIRGQA
jgi:hypothetical protein